MEATGRQPTTLKGLSSFLVEHEPCGAGFDVSHPAGLGSGRVSMTCRGCGATYEYATATIEFEREVEFEPVTVAATTEAVVAEPPSPTFVAQPPAPAIEAPAPPAPSPPAGDSDESDPEPESKQAAAANASSGPRRTRRSPKRLTRERAITAALLLFSVAALAFVVIRIAGDDNESSSTSTPTPSVATTPTTAVKTTPTAPKPAHPTPAPKPKPKQPKASPATPTANEQVIKTSRFSVIVPSDWTQRGASGGGTLLAPAGSAPVSLQVFFENDPGLTEQRMSAQTARFLRSRDPSAAVSSPQKKRVAGNPAFQLDATGPAGTQTAVGVLADPYRYLVLLSVDPGTSKAATGEAERALGSFQPR
jgi:hypothetical protein